MTRWLAARWRPSRIGLRLLAFNLLVVFVPVASVLYLDVYESRLLQAQEREMVQQGRVLAAALGGTAVIDRDAVSALLMRLGRRGDARLRVFDAAGALLADSDRVPPEPGSIAPAAYPAEPAGLTGPRGRILYRVGAGLANAREALTSRLRSWIARAPDEGTGLPGDTVGVVLRDALAGRYGAAIGPTPGQRSLTMFSAVAIRNDSAITGAIVVSQSTFRILQALYDIRLRLFEIIIASIVVAAVLTTVAATTIVRPLTRLRRRADALAQRHTAQAADFPATNRRDEIGALARALQQLTRRLDEQIARLEAFAADVAHEFRNPLASIRTAADVIETAESETERQRFLAMMRRDIQRLDRLVVGTRELARLDAQIEHEAQEAVDLGEVVRTLAAQPGPADRPVVVNGAATRWTVRGSRERLIQAVDNLLSNAREFAPPGSVVDVEFEPVAGGCRLTVADRGPGIPEAHLPQVFDRFFTYRPGSDRRAHLGLGLAITKQVIEGYGGTIRARNRDDGGAVFEVELPLAS